MGNVKRVKVVTFEFCIVMNNDDECLRTVLGYIVRTLGVDMIRSDRMLSDWLRCSVDHRRSDALRKSQLASWQVQASGKSNQNVKTNQVN
jgi:hypothetical protein